MPQNIVQQNIASSLVNANQPGVSYSFVTGAIAQQLHPYYRTWVTNTYGNQRITQWVGTYGAKGTRPNMSFRHAEKQRLQEPLVSAGATTGAAGTATVITLDPTCLVNGTQTPLTNNMVVYFKDKTTGYVTNIPAANQVEITPSVSTQVISVAAGENFFFGTGRVVGEGALQGNSGQTYPPVEFISTMDFIRYDEQFTEEEMVAINKSIEFYSFVDSETGAEITLAYQSQIRDAEVMFLNSQELYITSGVQVNQSGLVTSGINGVTGVIPTIISVGTNKKYSNIAGFQIADLNDMSLVIKRNNSPTEYMWWGGAELNNQFEIAIKDWFPNGAVTYGAFGGDMKAALAFGYRSISAFGVTWHINDNPLFMNPSFHGAPGMPYPKAAIVCPATNTFTMGGQAVKYIETVQLASEAGRLAYDFFYVDGTGILEKGQSRATNASRCVFTWKNTVGAELTAAKHLFFVEGRN